jgi:hypothetical protein
MPNALAVSGETALFAVSSARPTGVGRLRSDLKESCFDNVDLYSGLPKVRLRSESGHWPLTLSGL